jgi:hypothetical protein
MQSVYNKFRHATQTASNRKIAKINYFTRIEMLAADCRCERLQKELNNHRQITLRRLFEIIDGHIPVTKINVNFDDDCCFVNYIICYVDHTKTEYEFDDFELTHKGLYVIGLSNILNHKLHKSGNNFKCDDIIYRYEVLEDAENPSVSVECIYDPYSDTMLADFLKF